jgi:hypothetical protein
MKYVVFFLILLTSCVAKRAQVEKTIPLKDRILFLVFNASRDSSSSNTKINLIKQIESVGKLKQTKSHSEAGANYLLFQFFQKGNLLDTVKVEHPLVKHFEYQDERNQMAVKDTMILNCEFFHRFQLNNGKYKLHIYEMIYKKPPYFVTSFEL